ncbi:cupredoxin domain-containing protein [Methylolobus aquaticus]
MKYAYWVLLALSSGLAAVQAMAAEVVVRAGGTTFSPEHVEINVGDTVKWELVSSLHTSTSGTDCRRDGKWDSSGTTFSRTFTEPGTYPYFCFIHCFSGMTGTVTVKPAVVEDPRVEQGLAIAPVRLRYSPRQRDAVGLGSYIVNAQGSCADCHSCPTYAKGHNPFKGEPKQFRARGYLAGGVTFGPFVSRNLTKDENGLPAGMTLAQFRATMRTGKDLKNVHPDISPLLQVMPWPMLGQMTNDDLDAVYQYLRAIPAAIANPAACSGPGE